MKREILLSDCPDKLQASVNLYMENNPLAKLLSVQKWVSTPYKDKEITNTRYLAFLQNGNYFSVYKIGVCSKSEWSDDDVTVSGMIAGEILELVAHSDLLKA